MMFAAAAVASDLRLSTKQKTTLDKQRMLLL